VREPVRNALTRLAVEACVATGELRLVGYERTGGLLSDVAPATEALHLMVGPDRAVRIDNSDLDVLPAHVPVTTSMSPGGPSPA
jgi:hypothetical protein